MLRVLILVEANPHRKALHHFDVVSGRVFGWKQAEHGTSRSRKTLNRSLVVAAERVHSDRDRLTRSHVFELRLFEVCGDPEVIQRDDREQTLSGLHAMPQLHGLSSDYAAHGSVDFRITEIQLSGAQVGASLLQMAACRIGFRARIGYLLGSDPRGIYLRLALCHETSGLGDFLL